MYAPLLPLYPFSVATPPLLSDVSFPLSLLVAVCVLLAEEYRYLVHTRLGAGSARQLAIEPEHREMKLIPWGGVAALLSHTRCQGAMDLCPPMDGLAFCFLPLPVNTQLPVHVCSDSSPYLSTPSCPCMCSASSPYLPTPSCPCVYVLIPPPTCQHPAVRA
jgi:hypothetical protein